MDKFNTVYYLGVLFLISGVVYIMVNKLKTFDKILKEHILIIVIYIALLILSITLWRMVINHIENTYHILHSNDHINYEKMING